MKRRLPKFKEKILKIERRLPLTYIKVAGDKMQNAIREESTVKKDLPKDENGKVSYKGQRGGYRPNAGRKKGSRSVANMKRAAFEKLMAVIYERRKKELGRPPTSLECYQAIRDDMDVPFSIREIAMSRALPYESSKLSSTELIPGSEGGMDERITNAKHSLESKLLSFVVHVGSEEVAQQANRG